MVMAALSSWGRLRVADHEVMPLGDRNAVAATMARSALPGIAYGNGRCYGDECLNAGRTAWTTRGLDRFIAFDKDEGVLRCEAGVLLDEITRVILPANWFLPVTPGTAFATIGGAVANDVHGKNHQRFGTIGEHVVSLRLSRSDGSTLGCSPAENPDLFAATIGGMGLTGTITEVAIRLRRVPGPWIDTITEPFETLEEFFTLSAHLSRDWEYTVAWIDCNSARRDDTRGVFFGGNHSAARVPVPRALTLDAAWLPDLRWVNGPSTAIFNALYFANGKRRRGRGRQHYASFFYPLDRIARWNRIYGKSGFYQYQCVLPEAHQVDGTRELLRLIAQSRTGSFLSVLKTFAARPAIGMLSFPMAGTTIALDFPNRGARTLQLFDQLNTVVAKRQGRLYAAKDCAMPAALFRQGHPRLDEFLPFRDPGVSSDMARRLLPLAR